jgi:hypothetical protein
MPPLRMARQELFAQGIAAEGKSIKQAYADAGYKYNETNAQRLASDPVVKARIAEIQGKRELIVTKTTQEALVAQKVTIESLIEELNEAYVGARDAKRFDAMVKATLGKARICGLLIDRAEIKPVSDFSGMTSVEFGECMIGTLIGAAGRLGLDIETASLGEFLIGLQDEIMGVDDESSEPPGQPHWKGTKSVAQGLKVPGYGKPKPRDEPRIINGSGRRR